MSLIPLQYSSIGFCWLTEGVDQALVEGKVLQYILLPTSYADTQPTPDRNELVGRRFIS